MQVEYDHLFKILLLGDTAVGKTCLMLRFCEDVFVEQHNRTVGVDFRIKKCINIFGLKIKLQILDHPPPTKFNKSKPSYYRNAHGIIILHDPSQPLDSLKHWLRKIDRYGWENVSKFIVANKCDLENNECIDDIKELAEGLGITFMNISAKESINCEECFVNLAWELMLKRRLMDAKRNIITFAQ